MCKKIFTHWKKEKNGRRMEKWKNGRTFYAI